MTRKDYEARYAEAVQVLRGKIRDIGDPGITPDGVRFLRVGGMLCDDEIVFRSGMGQRDRAGHRGPKKDVWALELRHEVPTTDRAREHRTDF